MTYRKTTGLSCLINHPLYGSLWLDNCEIKDGMVRGEAAEEISGFNIPEGGPFYDYVPMTFPVSCIRKEHREELG